MTTSPDLLVIEDSDEDFAATQRALKQNAKSIRMQRFTTGDEALDYLYRRGAFASREAVLRPLLILLDLNLPGTDGRELLAEIKNDEKLKIIPVVVLTTSNNPKDIEECYRNGANSYQIKPVDYARFKDMIHNLVIYWMETATFPEPQE